MPSVTVQDIPPVLFEELRQRATHNRRSIATEILVCLEEVLAAEKREVETYLAQARSIRERSRGFGFDDRSLWHAKRLGRS